MSKRVGVIADTHCPEFLAELPPEVSRAFQGVDLILHAGDVSERSTLETLRRWAPVEAVRGDHDAALSELPATRELIVDGKRVVLVHGQRTRWIEEPNTLLWTLSLGHYVPNRGVPRALKRRFPHADVIVYGHTHRPAADVIDGTLVFNPGAVHQWNPTTTARRLGQRPGWFEWCWLQVARHMRRYKEPSVGILEFAEGKVRPSIVPL